VLGGVACTAGSFPISPFTGILGGVAFVTWPVVAFSTSASFDEGRDEVPPSCLSLRLSLASSFCETSSP